MDNSDRVRETGGVLKPGSSRDRLARTLNAAFAEGLLSEQTLSLRLGMLFGPRLIEPRVVIGDLALRGRGRRLRASALLTASRALYESFERIVGRATTEPAPLVLALDWSGAQDELLIGRAGSCDVVLEDQTVSR